MGSRFLHLRWKAQNAPIQLESQKLMGASPSIKGWFWMVKWSSQKITHCMRNTFSILRWLTLAKTLQLTSESVWHQLVMMQVDTSLWSDARPLKSLLTSLKPSILY
jgi:hypothetical protein